MLKIQLACICENAFLSVDGKMNIIGELNQIAFSKKYENQPMILPVYIVSAYLSNEPGKYEQVLRFIRQKNNEKFQADVISKFEIKKEKAYVVTKLNLMLPDFEDYYIQILTEGGLSEPLLNIPFKVRKFKK